MTFQEDAGVENATLQAGAVHHSGRYRARNWRLRHGTSPGSISHHAARLQRQTPRFRFRRRHGRICLSRSHGATAPPSQLKAVGCYKNHRFPPQIIAHAVWLHFRLPLSLRSGRANVPGPWHFSFVRNNPTLGKEARSAESRPRGHLPWHSLSSAQKSAIPMW